MNAIVEFQIAAYQIWIMKKQLNDQKNNLNIQDGSTLIPSGSSQHNLLRIFRILPKSV